ncbi:MAG TPA: helix-hairpin-helix domain-containing protein [Thermoflexales bacterium]|nr:helix-hairpin-helix domain-containing protein [Thermoflexales bacterium]
MAVLGLILLGAGIAAGRLTANRTIRAAKAESEQIRFANEAAVVARSQAVNERERALGELDTRKQELNLLENQIRSLQRQLDQARAAWRAAEKQVEDLGNQVKEGRAQTDALRVANVNLEKVATERQIALNKANLHITELEARLADTQSAASERQSLLANANAQISRYRSRIVELDYAASELESGVSALGSYMQALRRRMADAATLEDIPARPTPPADGSLTVASPPEPEYAPTGSLAQATESVEGKLASLADNVAALGASLGMASSTLDSAPMPISDPAPAPVVDTAPEPVIPAAAIPNTVEEAGDFSQLQAINGIGVMYALTLTKGGISSVADLANASVDQVDAVIRAPRWRKPDYADWIRQAREVAGMATPA